MSRFSVVKIPTEFQECLALYKWAQLNPTVKDYLIHHVNEGKRSPITGNLFKRIGLRKGLPDYQLPVKNSNWIGLWLEMKRRDQVNVKKRPEQVEWLEKLSTAGHYTDFCYGWEDAVKKITDYLEDKI